MNENQTEKTATKPADVSEPDKNGNSANQTPAKTSTADKTSAKTGDSAPIAIIIVLLVVSAIAITILLIKRLKKPKHYK
ncbi:MAG: sortase B protein-sorting domain-containing protein [Eubacterium sp.]|nr:sortase B protein-sorting domain-containing protein [Eubacterium sp.]